MKKAFSIILSILWTTGVFSQVITTNVRGQLKDATTGETLINATLKLVRAADSLTVSQKISNKNGFLLKRIPPGTYFLKASYIGYRDTTYVIIIAPNDSIYNAGTLAMVKSGDDLQEVIVKATLPPVTTKNDTLIYNAGTFKTRPYTTVEDLLKKLPGIEVDRDGNILFQGERIRKIYVDGKEFFVNDPKLATQNLLADMVEKVEAFDDKSERAKLTGIPDVNPGKAINLRLNPDKKNGYFGNITSDYASSTNYNVSASANLLKADAIAMIRVSNNNSGLGRVSYNAKNISANYRNAMNQKLDFNISYGAGKNNSRYWSSGIRQTFFSDSSFSQEREETTAAENSNHSLSFGLQYKIDPLSKLSLTAALGIPHANNNSVDIANSSIEKSGETQPANSAFTNNQNNQSSWNCYVNLDYHHRFRKQGRYMGLNFNGNSNRLNGNGLLASLTRFYDYSRITVDSIERKQRSHQVNNILSFGFKISYFEPIGKNQVLDFYYTLNNSNSKSYRQANNYNPLTDKYDVPDSIGNNNFEINNEQHSFGFGYNNFKSSKLQYQAGIGILKARLQSANKTANLADEQIANNFFPGASLQYSINKQRSLRVAYNGKSRQPTITELQPIPDYSNPLLISVGNPLLKPEFTHQITTECTDFNAKKMRSFTINVNYRSTVNRIINSLITDAQGIQEQKHVNVNGDYGVGGSVRYEISLIKQQKPLSLRYNASLGFYRDANLVNGELNKRHVLTVDQQLKLDYHLGDKLFAACTGNFNLSTTRYSIQTSATNTIIFHQYSGNISYEFPRQIIVYTDFVMFFNHTQQKLKGRNSVVWNASISKRMFKNKNGEVKLSIADIFNEKQNFNQTIGDNYIESTRTDVVKRIFNLSFVYKFRGNKI